MARAAARARPQGPPPKPKKYLALGPFKKLNTKLARQSLADDELAWLENVMIVGPNNLQSVPAQSGTLVNMSNVVRQFWAGIGSTDYIIAFLVNGGCLAINVANNAVTTVAPAGTFSTHPDLTVWANQRILIIDEIAGYATWDGTLFVKSGGVSPNIVVTNGGTYSSTPGVTISGGSGSGATAVAIMGGSGSNQFVGEVQLTNPGTGYQPGDVLTVTFSSGAATATAQIMPQVFGVTITIFGGRVWWASQPNFPVGASIRNLNFTGTAGYDDMNVANGAGSTFIADWDVAHNITVLRGLNNYLYVFGDNSIKSIGSITIATGGITLFTILTISSDIGTTFLMTVISYNRFTVFANKNGVYGIFGSSVQKISDDMDGIFQQIDFGQELCAALNDVHLTVTNGGSYHCFVLLVKYITFQPANPERSLLLCFDGKSWFLVSAGIAKTMCSLPSQSVLQWTTFATFPVPGTGTCNLVELLADPTTAVNIQIITSLSPARELHMAKQPLHAAFGVQWNNVTTNSPPLALNVDTENGTFQRLFTAPGLVSGYFLLHGDVEGYGHYLGLTLTGTVTGTNFNAQMIEYVDADVWGDTFPPPPTVVLTDETGTIILTDETGTKVITR